MRKTLKDGRYIIGFILCFLIINIQMNDAFSKKQYSFNFKIEKEIKPYPPHLGEEIEVIFTVISPYDLDDTHFMLFALSGAELISIDPIGFSAREETNEGYLRKRNIKKWLWFRIKAHEKKAFKLRAKIDNWVPDPSTNEIFILVISVGVESWTEEHRGGAGSYTLTLFLIDKDKGILGSRAELNKGKPIVFRYDAEKRKIFPPRMREIKVDVEQNRDIIEMLRKSEPSLSDSEAILLHRDFLRIGIPKEIDSLDEEGIFKFYLRNGWLDAMRTGKRQEWINKEKFKIAKAYASEYEKRSWLFINFPLVLGLACTISLIFLVVIRAKGRRKNIK